MFDTARPVAERVADASAAVAGVTVSGATWFGLSVPVLIQHATLVLILVQIVWWLYKMATHCIERLRGDKHAGKYATAGRAAPEAHGSPDQSD